jgi:hypothetical protein
LLENRKSPTLYEEGEIVMNTLFRLTKNRRILMDTIISPLKDKVQLKEGYGRETALLIPNEDIRAVRLSELAIETQRLKNIHDVLETVASHNHDLHLQRFRLQERIWKTEWDIPLELFVEAVDYALEQLERMIVDTKYESNRIKYKKATLMIEKLKQFRTGK